MTLKKRIFSILSQLRELEGRSRVPAAPQAESSKCGRQEDESQDDGPAATCQAGYSQVRSLRSLPHLLFQSPTPWELDLENQWEWG